MPKGKPWTLEDEKRLRQLVQEGKPINVIAEVLHKTEDAVHHKCKRLELPVEEGAKAYTSSSIKLPKELPSVEETLRILAGALRAATASGLEKVEVQRLQVISTLSRTYNERSIDLSIF